MSLLKNHETSLGILLWQLTNQWQRRQRQALALLDLTHAQFLVLTTVLRLSSLPGNVVTQKKVSDASKIDKMSLSDLTTTLIEKKLLKRDLHRQDKRAYSLSLTAKGRQIAYKAIPLVKEMDVEFFRQETHSLLQLIQHWQNLISNPHISQIEHSF